MKRSQYSLTDRVRETTVARIPDGWPEPVEPPRDYYASQGVTHPDRLYRLYRRKEGRAAVLGAPLRHTAQQASSV